MARLVVFDLDGTLIDSRRDLADSANAILAEANLGPLPEEAVGRMVGEGAGVLIARAFAEMSASPPPDALARFLELYQHRLLQWTRPYEGVPELLAELHPRVKLAVLTNKPLASTREILAGLGLDNWFLPQFVIGGDGPWPRKPDPSSLRYLTSALEVALEETLLVGDSVIDWHTARAAPCAVCLARYGFGFTSLPDGVLQPGDRVIDRPLDLLPLLS